MKINLDEILLDINGNPVTFPGDKSPQTVRSIALVAILNEGAEELDAEGKLRRYDFAKRVKAASFDTDFSDIEVGKIVDHVCKMSMFGPWIVGAMVEIIKGK